MLLGLLTCYQRAFTSPENDTRKGHVSNQSAPNFDQYFELNELKAQSQEKDTVIKKLKERIKSLIGNMNEDKVKKYIKEIETINIEFDHKVSKLIAENEHLKQTYKQLYDSIKPTRIRSKDQCDALVSQVNQNSVEISNLNVSLQEKDMVITTLKDELRKLKGKDLDDLVDIHKLLKCTLETIKAIESDTPKPVVTLVYSRKHKKSKTNVPVSKSKIIKSISANKKEPSKSWGSIVSDVLSSSLDECTVKFENDHVEKILGYGDYQIGNVTISRVYFVEGLGHKLFSVGQFCDSDLEVAFRQHTCFIRNLKGVDLLTGSQGNNLYTLSLGDMMARNHTLIEAARTILIYAKAPLFLWAEAVATTCYTQNRSVIRLRHGKTPYELLHDKLPDLSFFHVFGALCYPTNDNYEELAIPGQTTTEFKNHLSDNEESLGEDASKQGRIDDADTEDSNSDARGNGGDATGSGGVGAAACSVMRASMDADIGGSKFDSLPFPTETCLSKGDLSLR
ncbi:retrovirus-related pol polyprotein from transposon TNT 1-94 [Tanacetum coccineum]